MGEASLGTTCASMGPSDITPLHPKISVLLDRMHILFVASTRIYISVTLANVAIVGCVSAAVSAVKLLTLRTRAWCPSLHQVHEGTNLNETSK